MAGMIQQVNFYYPALKPQKKPFDAAAMLIMITVVVVALSALSVYSYKQSRDLENDVAHLTAKKQFLVDELERAKVRLKPREKNQLLISRQLKLQKDIQSAQRLAYLLRTQIETQDKPYSDYFRGFASTTRQGLWLNQLRLTDGGSTLAFAGETLQPELVPQLLQGLSRLETFKGISFSNLQMSREETENAQKVLFELKTRVKKAEDDNAG